MWGRAEGTWRQKVYESSLYHQINFTMNLNILVLYCLKKGWGVIYLSFFLTMGKYCLFVFNYTH